MINLLYHRKFDGWLLRYLEISAPSFTYRLDEASQQDLSQFKNYENYLYEDEQGKAISAELLGGNFF